MIIEGGWANSYAEKRFGIKLGDSDLMKYLQDRGVDPARYEEIPFARRFTLLYLETEFLCAQTHRLYDETKVTAEDMNSLAKEREAAYEAVLRSLGVDGNEHAG